MTGDRPKGTRREQTTAETRRLVLDAALREFQRSGYAESTAADIAAAAGVSVATVYTSVGTKPVLLETLVREGTEGVEVPQSVERIEAATSSREVLQALAHGTRTSNERFEPVVHLVLDNPRAEPVVAVMQEVQDSYQAPFEATTRRLQELGDLRPGTTEEQVRGTLWLHFGLHAYPALTRVLGWDYDTAEAWLTTAAERTLLVAPEA